MSSTRNTKDVGFRFGRFASPLALVAALSLIGCQRLYVERPEPLNTEPVAVDEAMQLRQWAQVSATYPNGATDAGPTGFTWEPKREMEEWNYYYADPGVYFLNLFVMPYRLVVSPPWARVTYRGVWIEPTYHAMPPLPPEPAMMAMEAAPEAPAEPSDPAAPPEPPAPPEPSETSPTTQPG
jgi:hypothetical protein